MPKSKIYDSDGAVKADPLASGRIIPTCDCEADSASEIHMCDGPMSHPWMSDEYSGAVPTNPDRTKAARRLVEGDAFHPGQYPFQRYIDNTR